MKTILRPRTGRNADDARSLLKDWRPIKPDTRNFNDGLWVILAEQRQRLIAATAYFKSAREHVIFKFHISARLVAIGATFFLSSGMVAAQAKPPSTLAEAPKLSSIGIEQQWEYIVVSYGKTLFGSPQKTLAYRSIGLTGGQEAPDLENSLDILGRFGWEVITIVGSIGGDQQIVLKRRYNRNLVSNEYSAIIKGKDLYIKDLIDIMEREQRLREQAEKNAEAEKSRPRLVNLDEVDATNKRLEKESALKVAYQDAFAKSELSKFSTAQIDTKFSVRIVIEADVTSQLLKDGVNYRKSEVEALIRPLLASYRFIHPSVERYGSVSITVKANIQFGGGLVTVYTASTSNYQGSSTGWIGP